MKFNKVPKLIHERKFISGPRASGNFLTKKSFKILIVGVVFGSDLLIWRDIV